MMKTELFNATKKSLMSTRDLYKDWGTGDFTIHAGEGRICVTVSSDDVRAALFMFLDRIHPSLLLKLRDNEIIIIF